jgi:hypothetical protein
MDDKLHKIQNDLTIFFVQYEHRREAVPMTAKQFEELEEQARWRYHSDSMFSARVNMIVAKTMDIIRGYI